MFSVLKRWLGQDDVAVTGDAAATAARRSLNEFRPELIESLQTEHRQLLALFDELERAHEQNDEAACRSALDRFARALQDHLLTENRHLYGWFARNPDTDPEIARRVDSMSADMMHVGKILHRFITTYTRTAWTETLQTQLGRDIRVIGEVLAHRIHEEEKILYPLYAPRSAN